MSLKILMADDHEEQIEDARKSLRELGHDVRVATNYKDADEFVRNEPFDIVVIDLGWPDDNYLQSIGQDGLLAGYDLLRLVKEKNPGAFRILYTFRANEVSIVEAATKLEALCIKKESYRKPESKYTRLYLAYVVTAIAMILLDRNVWKKEVVGLSEKLSLAEEDIKNLKQFKETVDLEEKKYRRVMTIVVSIPIIDCILFVLIWLVTKQTGYAISAFGAGLVAVLISLLALGLISRLDIEALGKFWPTSIPKT